MKALSSRQRLAVGVVTAFTAITAMIAPATAANAASGSSSAVPTLIGTGLVLNSTARQNVVHPMSSPTDCSKLVSGGGHPLCFWVSANFVGKMGALYGQNAWWANFSQPQCTTGDSNGTWNDCASGLYNAGSEIAVIYQDKNYSGGRGCVVHGTTGFADLANYTWGNNGEPVNDSISSNSWTTNSSLC